MAEVTSNIVEVTNAIKELAHFADFDRGAGGRRVGALIAEAIAIGIFKRSLGQQVDPSGQPFADLSPAYLRWKVKHGYSPRKNVKTGKMLSLEEIRGTTQITKYGVWQEYGRTPETKKLEELAREGSSNRPARPFYGLDADIIGKIYAILDEAAKEAGAR